MTHKEIITCHAWLSGDTGGDDDNVAPFESFLGAIVRGQKTGHSGRRRNMGDVGRNLEEGKDQPIDKRLKDSERARKGGKP